MPQSVLFPTVQPDTAVNTHRIQEMAFAFMQSQLMFTAVDLNLFTLIARQNNTLDALIAQTGASERGLRLLLTGLVGVGLLTEDVSSGSSPRFGLPADVATFLVDDGNPNFLGGWINHCKLLTQNWSSLTDCVESGLPAGGHQSLAEVERFFADLVQALAIMNQPSALKLAETLKNMLPSGQPLSILDVAGGSGVWSAACLNALPDAKATLLDYPSVIDVAKRFSAQWGLQDRYSYLPGDLEEETFPANAYDVAIAGHICHAVGAESARALLAKLYASLKPNGILVLVDYIPSQQATVPNLPRIYGVNMLVSTLTGEVFNLEEYRQWLSEAGFHALEPLSLSGQSSAVLARKP
jgi:ubiquinone/menaquinone biosynthesis C-methylase UbiE